MRKHVVGPRRPWQCNGAGRTRPGKTKAMATALSSPGQPATAVQGAGAPKTTGRIPVDIGFEPSNRRGYAMSNVNVLPIQGRHNNQHATPETKQFVAIGSLNAVVITLESVFMLPKPSCMALTKVVFTALAFVIWVKPRRSSALALIILTITCRPVSRITTAKRHKTQVSQNKHVGAGGRNKGIKRWA